MREALSRVGPGPPRPLQAQVGGKLPECGQPFLAPPAHPSHPRFIALVDNTYQSVVTLFLVSLTNPVPVPALDCRLRALSGLSGWLPAISAEPGPASGQSGHSGTTCRIHAPLGEPGSTLLRPTPAGNVGGFQHGDTRAALAPQTGDTVRGRRLPSLQNAHLGHARARKRPCNSRQVGDSVNSRMNTDFSSKFTANLSGFLLGPCLPPPPSCLPSPRHSLLDAVGPPAKALVASIPVTWTCATPRLLQ